MKYKKSNFIFPIIIGIIFIVIIMNYTTIIDSNNLEEDTTDYIDTIEDNRIQITSGLSALSNIEEGGILFDQSLEQSVDVSIQTTNKYIDTFIMEFQINIIEKPVLASYQYARLFRIYDSTIEQFVIDIVYYQGNLRIGYNEDELISETTNSILNFKVEVDYKADTVTITVNDELPTTFNIFTPSSEGKFIFSLPQSSYSYTKFELNNLFITQN